MDNNEREQPKEVEEREGFDDMEDREILCKAMIAAYGAFNKHISDHWHLDAAYFSLYLTGYLLGEDFTKLEEIKMNLNATGVDKFEYPDTDNNETSV